MDFVLAERPWGPEAEKFDVDMVYRDSARKCMGRPLNESVVWRVVLGDE